MPISPALHRSVTFSVLALTLAVAGLSACTAEIRPDHPRYEHPAYQPAPVYEQPTYSPPPPPVYVQPAPVYQVPPPPPPPPQVIVEHRPDPRDIRAFAMDALGRLHEADSRVVPNHLDPSKDSLRAARETLRRAPHDPILEDALNRIDAALDAAEHSRPRIEQDHIQEAIQILHDRFEVRR